MSQVNVIERFQDQTNVKGHSGWVVAIFNEELFGWDALLPDNHIARGTSGSHWMTWKLFKSEQAARTAARNIFGYSKVGTINQAMGCNNA